MSEPGAIRSEEAYALGKMLDHSAWQRGTRLVRGITPSDVDMGFDNNGMIIFGELSSIHAEWQQLETGQRRFYENCIKGGIHCAVLCKHNVKPEDRRKIDTRNDIVSFQAMVWDHAPVLSSVITGNHYWQKFVFDWVDDSYGPLHLRRTIIGASVGKCSPIGGEREAA